jgi:hypothetical protein
MLVLRDILTSSTPRSSNSIDTEHQVPQLHFTNRLSKTMAELVPFYNGMKKGQG